MGDNKVMNPQRALFKENYCNPESETFGNAYQSAIKAGFSEDYATTITAPSREIEWVAEIVRDVEMLSKAEKVLNKTLGFIDDDDAARQKLAQDSAKFIAPRLGKKKWAERQEHSGPEGQPIDINLNKLDDDQLDKLIAGIQATVGGTSHRETEKDSGEPA